jgi:hypothetical protein
MRGVGREIRREAGRRKESGRGRDHKPPSARAFVGRAASLPVVGNSGRRMAGWQPAPRRALNLYSGIGELRGEAENGPGLKVSHAADLPEARLLGEAGLLARRVLGLAPKERQSACHGCKPVGRDLSSPVLSPARRRHSLKCACIGVFGK